MTADFMKLTANEWAEVKAHIEKSNSEMARLDEKLGALGGEFGGLKVDIAVIKSDVLNMKESHNKLAAKMDSFDEKLDKFTQNGLKTMASTMVVVGGWFIGKVVFHLGW